VLDKIIRERSKSDGAKKAAEKRKLTSDMIADNILKSPRLTSGIMTKNSIHSLSDPRFLEPFRQRRIETQNKDEEKKSKRKALHGNLVSAVKVLRTKLGHEIIHKFEQCDKNECGAYLEYKKQPKDKAMPKDLIGRRERCVEWITCPSPTASPNQSDDEDNDAADAEEGLLGMAAIGGISPDMLERDGVKGGVNENDDEYGW